MGARAMAVHEVQVEVVETGGARPVGGADGFLAPVDTPQGLELGVLETLDADRQPIDAQAAIGDELGLLEGAGVGFQGDLDVRREAQAPGHAVQ